MTRTLLLRATLALVVLLAAAQLYRPERSNPPVDPALAFETSSHAPAAVLAIVQRSCYDCHSYRTRWPWYSNVAPVSWGVASDVREARNALNFSTWGSYPPKRLSRKLEAICDELRQGDMPLLQYRLVHSDAKLSEAEVRTVCDWATAEADRVVEPQAAALPAVPPAVTRGDMVFVSGTLPGKAPGPGADDITAQTTRVLTTLDATLRQAGSSLAQTAATTVILRKAEDFPAMNAAYAKFFPADPPSRTTVVADLLDPDAQVQISAVAARQGVPREVIHPEGWARSPSPYNYGIKVGDTLYLAGLVARRGTDNTPVPGDIAVQMRTIGDNAATILGAAGMSARDVVSAKVFLTDTTLFDAMNTAYRAWFSAAPPARATVRTALMAPDSLVEVTMVAVRGGTHQALTTPNADGTPGKANPNLSSAIGIGPRTWVSGMLGVMPGTKGNQEAETAEMFARIGRTLQAAGRTWADVADGIVFVTDVAAAARVLEQFKTAAGGTLPAVTVAGVGLVSPDATVEVMVSAVR